MPPTYEELEEIVSLQSKLLTKRAAIITELKDEMRKLKELTKDLEPKPEGKPTLNPVTVVPNTLKAGDRLGLKIIAVINWDGTWTAYRGLTDWDDEKVASNGDALLREQAEPLFYAPKTAGFEYDFYV